MCEHENIVIVTETPRGEINGRLTVQQDKTFIECADCHEQLPIYRVTKEKRYIPLILTPY